MAAIQIRSLATAENLVFLKLTAYVCVVLVIFVTLSCLIRVDGSLPPQILNSSTSC